MSSYFSSFFDIELVQYSLNGLFVSHLFVLRAQYVIGHRLRNQSFGTSSGYDPPALAGVFVRMGHSWYGSFLLSI